MTSRREFLQIGITAATAWPLASGAARADAIATRTAAAATGPLPIYKVIVDERFEESVQFGRRAGTLGLAVHAIEGDMTRFWYDELYHQWKQGPIAIAGFTAHGPMFCFETLGRDQGLRAVFRARHERTHAGAVAHSLTGPLDMLRASAAIAGDGALWSCRMAEVIAECPQGRSEIATQTTTTVTDAWSLTGDDDALYSWVIAPAARA